LEARGWGPETQKGPISSLTPVPELKSALSCAAAVRELRRFGAMSIDLHLRYLDADQVDTPVGRLTAMTLISPSDETVGSLTGVILDVIERRVRYFVVESRRWWRTKRYLVPFTPTRIDSERHRLRVELEPRDLPQLPAFHSASFSRVSDDDLIGMLFRSHAA
jgi:PRC-barrel domain protein